MFDIPMLAERLEEAALWIASKPDVADLPLGLFGASTGAAAALLAGAEMHDRVAAVVSRGGRRDLAGPRLSDVRAPTLLIVGRRDDTLIALNRETSASLACEKLLRIVPGAWHPFEETGTLEQVMALAGARFQHDMEPLARTPTPPVAVRPSLIATLRAANEPLPERRRSGFGAAFDRFAGARAVLLGEVSHGTSELCRARAAITRRLIERHGFTIVAAEADWPDAAVIDRHVRHLRHRAVRTPPFTRFPTWMWRNKDVEAFVAFLRRHNAGLPPAQRVGFYGLDLFNMTASVAADLAYLDSIDPEAAAVARAVWLSGTLVARTRRLWQRGADRDYAECEDPVTRNLLDMLRSEPECIRHDGDRFFDAAQNARLIADAERCYRVMYYGSQHSWNLRDSHMIDTLQRLLDLPGPDSKAVVWAHKSHIGDARATDMGAGPGELNLGQPRRPTYGQDAVLIGFGTHAGNVAAALDWDAPMEVKAARPSRPDSYEAL